MRALSREAKFIGGCLLAAAILIVITAVVTPPPVVRDGRPTSYNTSERGIKAAYLALAHLGYSTSRWEKPAHDLDQVDAEHSALVITAPLPGVMVNV